jgi:hypothetical protein
MAARADEYERLHVFINFINQQPVTTSVRISRKLP